METTFYDQRLYEPYAPYPATHHQYGHHATQNIASVAPMTPASGHQRRDSNVGIGIDHSQSQASAQYTHHTHSPPLRQQQHQQQQQHQHQQVMAARPRSTSAVTVDAQGSAATLLHDSRPRAHSYADPRAATEQRAKQPQGSVEDIMFPNSPPVQEIDEEPLYVNAKQYHRILKRRIARARLAEIQKLSTQRKPYLHQSRHNHAVRRPRGPGGRFLTAEEIAARKAQDQNDHGGEGEDGTRRLSEGSPTQESTSTPSEDVGSPTRASAEKQPASTTSASSSFSYPTAATASNIAPVNGSSNGAGVDFENMGLGSILGTNAAIGINGGYEYAGAE